MKYFNFKKINNYKKAFTIIETLVAISILMIAIAGPLTIAQKGLLAANYARDQMVATFLTQDALEYAKNVLDYNRKVKDSSDWLTNISNCTVSQPCSIDTLNGDQKNTTTPLGENKCPSGYSVDDPNYTCPMFIRTSDTVSSSNCYYNSFGFYVCTFGSQSTYGYTPLDDGKGYKSQFNRVFYVIPSGDPNKVTFVARVFWKSGTIVNDVSYQYEVYNVTL